MVGDIGRAIALFSIPVAWWLGVLTLAQLFVVVFITGVLTVFFDVAYQSYLPALVESRPARRRQREARDERVGRADRRAGPRRPARAARRRAGRGRRRRGELRALGARRRPASAGAEPPVEAPTRRGTPDDARRDRRRAALRARASGAALRSRGAPRRRTSSARCSRRCSSSTSCAPCTTARASSACSSCSATSASSSRAAVASRVERRLRLGTRDLDVDPRRPDRRLVVVAFAPRATRSRGSSPAWCSSRSAARSTTSAR